MRAIAADVEVGRADPGLELQHVDRAGLIAFQVVAVACGVEIPVGVARQRTGGVAQRVLAVTAPEQVGVVAGAANHHVVAGAAVEHIVDRLPLQGFRAVPAVQKAAHLLQLEFDVDRARIGDRTVDDEQIGTGFFGRDGAELVANRAVFHFWNSVGVDHRPADLAVFGLPFGVGHGFREISEFVARIGGKGVNRRIAAARQ